ncbi:MAG: site-2 protease family protein [Candidatus Aenigmatarchaeota archaeon]
MIDPYTVSVLLFFALLGIIIYRDRKNIDFKYILLMRRTKRFSKILDTIAKKSVTFWKVTGTIAFVLCFLVMIYGTYTMINIAYLIQTGVIDQPALSFALPVPSDQMIVSPGFIGIPFWIWIIVITIILIPHEAFHGIIARAEKIKLKDVGLMLLAIFPGAFVEPDEKQLKKSKLMTKLRIFSAGSFINIVIGMLVIVLVQSLLWSPNVGGILITNVNETSPAYDIGLEEGMVIESIDGKELTMNFDEYSFLILMVSGSNSGDITQYISQLILFRELSAYSPGDTVSLRISGNDYDLTLAEHPEIEVEGGFPYIGVNSKFNVADVNMFFVLFPLLGLIATLSMLVGAFNILPIYPLDGGLIVQSLAERFAKKISKQIVIGVTAVMVVIIIFSFVGPLFL